MALVATELTDAMIAEAEGLVGRPLRIEQFHHEATLDTIRHFAWGYGDNNPLWRDEEYAAASTHGTIIAPPTFVVSAYGGGIGVGLRGIQPFGAGGKWEWFETIRRGDRIVADARLGPIRVLTGKHVRRFVLQTVICDFVRGDGTVIARAENRCFRVPRSKATGGLSYEAREPHRYTAAELEAIRVEAVSEPVRGAHVRYWEDVTVGDAIPRVVKGPIDLTTMIAWYCGSATTPRMKGSELAWLYRTWADEAPEKLPTNYDLDFFQADVAPSFGHIDSQTAADVGMPGAYANGNQKTAWMAHPVLNWMGDDGFLSSLEIRLSRPDIFGDTLWCSAAVTGKPSAGTVEIALRAESQLGEVTAVGTATVILQTRNA
jgi:acyl dehydratase